MRTINTDAIIEAVKQMCIDANLELSPDIKSRIDEAEAEEKSPLGKKILSSLQENMKIAKEDQIPICQDTGMAIVFVKLGQDLHIEGMGLTDAINEGVRRGYTEGFLRKSVVNDPIIRKNTGDNTPAIIHYDMVSGDKLEITLAPKGFGSENMSKIYMLKPADGIEGVKEAVIRTVKEAGPNACPPFVVGVGIGGDFEKCALLSKKALTRSADVHNSIDYVRDLEIELLDRINKIGLGPAGLGGSTTALAVNVEVFPTHIAGMPVAVNMCCHVNRHRTVVL
ncbi:MAG: fumarate hydratase [Lachnospiraceae bacterium]|jgi:fumarate hydratase subunit alpha|nr:fumarate hydratase [Lachnospiraceae bacterium]MEE3461766.1 fumarate hydratase [Lachnospiraceae bacterium]